MPRQARIDYPGALHHVICRGIEKKHIFKGDADKKDFLDRYRKILQESDARCFAWCIMGNHCHILLQTGQTPLPEIMRRLLTGYASSYNRRYHRVGHLFQNRYKSVLCDKDQYLLLLIRYIHLNPVRARMIEYKKLSSYKWTGHCELLKRKGETILEKEEVYSYFGQTMQKARKAYLQFVREGIGLRENLSGGGLIKSAGGIKSVLSRKKEERELFDERILGGGDFVSDVLQRIDTEEKKIVTRLKSIDTLNELIDKLSGYYEIEKESLLNSRVKNVIPARNLFIYFGNRYFGKSLTDLGKILGITQQAASYAYQRGREIENNEFISNKVF